MTEEEEAELHRALNHFMVSVENFGHNQNKMINTLVQIERRLQDLERRVMTMERRPGLIRPAMIGDNKWRN